MNAKIFQFLPIFLFMLLVDATVALAQDAANAVQESVIDLTNPVMGLVAAIGAALAVVIQWGIRKLAAKIGIDVSKYDKDIEAAVDKILDEAVDYGVGKLTKADWLKIETKHEAVAFAVNYALDQAPEMLEKAGLTQEKLIQKLEAKLAKHDTELGKWEDA